MQKLIQSALRKPLTIIVLLIGVVFFAVVSIKKIPVDIFPALDLPTIYVAQPYGGLAPDQMDGFIAAQYQNNFLYVSGIKNIQIKSVEGLTLLKLSFYPGTDMAQAAGEVANQVNRARASFPAGTVPPQVVRFDASSVPIGQLVFQSSSESLDKLQDLAASRIRPMFTTIPGVSSPPPFGGNQRTMVVKVDQSKLRNYNLSPEDVVKAIADNNQPSAAGNVSIGDTSYMTPVNSLVKDPSEFLTIPVKTGAGATVFVGDVATVEDAADITTGYALVNGRRAVYIPIVKKADASTLDVVNNIKANLPRLQAAIPSDVKLSYEFDQSVYVINSIKNLISEGTLGALLTGLMVFLLLKDIRSVIIVVLTIPLSILSAIILLNLFGQTINMMTLSGLALAIGILVDQATVTIENIHQHLDMNKPKAQAILDACREIIFPEFLITLCILAVFAPAFIMQGIPKSMFLPLSLAVGFSMIASFLLAQTMVPIFANWWIKDSHHHHQVKKEFSEIDVTKVVSEHDDLEDEMKLIKKKNPKKKIEGFEKFKIRYTLFLRKLLQNKKVFIWGYLGTAVILIGLGYWIIGKDILPHSNAGQFQIHLREPVGTRFERTEDATLKAISIINKEVGSQNVKITSAFVGSLPSSYAISSIFLFSSGSHEAILQVALQDGYKTNIDQLKEKLRNDFKNELPTTKISFEPIELTEKIMSQGSSTPIEISVGAKNIKEADQFASKIMAQLQDIKYLRDIQISQPISYPAIGINIDRGLAGQLGVTSSEITKSVVASTSSSRFTDKNLWLDPKSGIGYQVQVEIPVNQMNSISSIQELPVKQGQERPVISDVATLTMTKIPGEIDREGSNRLVTITANINNKDLGRAGEDVQKAVQKAGVPPRGVEVKTRGQVQLLTETLDSLQSGLILAVFVIFLLLSANFQSFKLSLVVLSTIPAVVVGSLLVLLLYGSTLNLQSYMGMIMCVGVAVANALLMITNAENVRLEIGNAGRASLMAANSRLRPILMTSIAMVAGMIPMAAGLGEGGDQVAPLGQAVVGGLIASTLASLLILPLVFSWVQGKASVQSNSLDPEDTASKFYINKSEISHP